MGQAIILIGGYKSLWPTYLRMARDLEDLSGLRAVGVPLMPWHWWSATQAGHATNILQKLSQTVMWARRRFQADRFILVGHSAGGLISRLYLSDRPVWGHTYAGVAHVSTLVTLGSPHCAHRESGRGRENGGNWYLVDSPNRLAPGAAYGDHVRYRTVAGHCVRGRPGGSPREQRAYQLYQEFGGREGTVWGDGVVPVTCAHLNGAETLVLEGVAHSARVGRAWYGGSKAIIRRWWPGEAAHVE